MQRNIFITQDGSHSIEVPDLKVFYHSKFGAIQESMHVFIKMGLEPFLGKSERLSIFEMGFGTGLNALLSLIEAEKNNQRIFYQAVESSPLPVSMISSLNYCERLKRPDLVPAFEQMHHCEWESETLIHPGFSLFKVQQDFTSFSTKRTFHIIYYDAFSPQAQPELWTRPIFQKIHTLLIPGGSLVTYCSKGEVRRAMAAAGFIVEKFPGPPGKREMVRASC